jgi:Tfp pilus assembly protein FimT
VRLRGRRRLRLEELWIVLAVAVLAVMMSFALGAFVNGDWW